jgi:hypothetical protein
MTNVGEKKFSANFQLYNMDGLRLQFTVRADDAREHMQLLQQQLDHLLREGYSVTEPDANAKPKVVPIVGWVQGTAQDNKTGQFLPCVHLYTPWGKFKAATVYHEKLHDLPVSLESAKLWDGPAPDKDSAIKRGVMNNCDFQIAMVPRTDFEGNVKKSESGNVLYFYDRVVGSQPQAGHRNDYAAQVVGPSRDELDRINVQDEDAIPWDAGPPEDDLWNQPDLTTKPQRDQMHALGALLYQGNWEKKRKELVGRYGLDSSNDLNVEQWESIMLELEEKAQAKINQYLDQFPQGAFSRKTTYQSLKMVVDKVMKQKA